MGVITVSADTLIKGAAVLGALAALLGYCVKSVKWYLRQAEQDKDIKAIKKENTLIVYALSACLDGLEQLGANHTVPVAKEKLNKYINQQAHDQLE